MARRLTPRERVERATASKHRTQLAILAGLATKYERGHLSVAAYQRALDRASRRCLQRAIEVWWAEDLVTGYHIEAATLSRRADDLTGRPHSRWPATAGEGES